MGRDSKIQWCDHSFNAWLGCQQAGPGCRLCYAEAWARRSGLVRFGPGEPRRRTSAANWRQPLKWQAEAAAFAEAHGRRQRVFGDSLNDVLDNAVPPEWRSELWRLVRATPDLDWLFVTKRIGNAPGLLPEDWGGGYPNVWLIATVCDQHEADRDVPKLKAVPAVIRGLSVEPQLALVTLLDHLYVNLTPTGRFRTRDGRRQLQFAADGLAGDLHWVVVGGESGAWSEATPFDLEWARALVRQCGGAGVPVFVKQLGRRPVLEGVPVALADPAGGEPAEWPADLRVREWPRSVAA